MEEKRRAIEFTICEEMVWNPAQRVVLLQRQSEGMRLICEGIGGR